MAGVLQLNGYTDWKHVDFLASPGALCGCDYSGIVEEVGESATQSWKVGDKICGMAHGGNGNWRQIICTKPIPR